LALGRLKLSIHPQAEQGFGRAAQAYDRGRPEYPAKAIEWLAEQLGLKAGRVVVDVGAGTGKLTRALGVTGARLIAVEPVPEMLEVLKQRAPGAEPLSASAEDIPLAAGSVDAVVAGQAFHWFDGPRALDEFHRLLRSDGKLGLIWNRRAQDQPLHQDIDEIIERYRGETPAYYSHRWSAAFEERPLFTLAERAEIPFEQDLDAEGFVDRVMSISFVAALDPQERRTVEDRLRELASEKLEPLRYTSQVFVYRRC
jgi:ubiquinone/menaquinone biosynthesis C-methylase UbiE